MEAPKTQLAGPADPPTLTTEDIINAMKDQDESLPYENLFQTKKPAWFRSRLGESDERLLQACQQNMAVVVVLRGVVQQLFGSKQPNVDDRKRKREEDDLVQKIARVVHADRLPTLESMRDASASYSQFASLYPASPSRLWLDVIFRNAPPVQAPPKLKKKYKNEASMAQALCDSLQAYVKEGYYLLDTSKKTYLPASDSVQLKPHLSLSNQTVATPVTVKFVLEVKLKKKPSAADKRRILPRYEQFSNSKLGQLEKYAVHLADANAVAFQLVAMTDWQSIEFLALYIDRATRAVKVERSGVMDWDGLGGTYLSAVLSDPDMILEPLVLEQAIAQKNVRVGLPLYFGATSVVFSDDGDKTRVLKVTSTDALARHENTVLTGVAADAPHAVRVVKYQRSQLLLTPRGVPLNKWKGHVPVKVYHNIWRCLFHIHCMNYVHRDVRPVNIVICQGVGYLIDFGYAANLLAPTPAYAGTSRFASLNVLDELRKGNTNFVVHPDDDIQSLIFTIYAMRDPKACKLLYELGADQHHQIRKFWKERMALGVMQQLKPLHTARNGQQAWETLTRVLGPH
eukprot:TRINITY_DN1559_c1_g8_i1.p1 TRINITY_DN1559_c1_g8~~TRINITY_DN1559_c1_g8_i1.p1  ORF type:complete len:570 (-),score=95.79 TRINITY_DN1559_c1_g8_i1:290-1999(-)